MRGNKAKSIERSMRGIKDSEGDEALAGLERETPGKQSASKSEAKRKMTHIRIEPAANGGFISHPDFAQAKSDKKDSGALANFESPKPNTHADLQGVHDYLDKHWGSQGSQGE